MASYLVTTRLGWLFREQETSDVGIDAQLEVVIGASLAAKATGGATGRLLAVQIKSGESQFAAVAEGGWWFPCDAAHVTYWQNHSLPVTLMLFDPETEGVYWQHVNADTLVSTGKHYKVFVPSHQQIDDSNAEALSRPARRQEDQDVEPIQAATDRLPGDARIRLLRDHHAGAEHALPLALLLADADGPARVVTELLTQPPAWFAGLETEDAEGAWMAIAAYACSHELGLLASDALERASAAASGDQGRLLALAALTAVAHSPDRARGLVAAADETGTTVLASAVQCLIDAGGQYPDRLPDVVARALAEGDPAATRDVNILLFAANCQFAADRYDDGKDMLEKALRLAPEEPSLQLDLAWCLIRRNAVGTPRQSSFDIDRAQRLALAARAGYRRWRGPIARAAGAVLQTRLMTGNVVAAIQTAIAEPEGDAQDPETSCEPLQLEAVRLAYKAGRLDLAAVIAARLISDGAKLQLEAYATEADSASSRESCIAAWEAALAGATNDDQRGTAAFALTSLGVWPVPYLNELHQQGVIPEAVYQARWAVAEAAQGAIPAAIRRLRVWANTSVAAALCLVDLYERNGQLMLAAEAAERAGQRFGDTPLRVLAIHLWNQSGAPDQASNRALTLLSRPFLSADMRSHLRGMAIQWAHDRSDWNDMEDQALTGLAEAAGIDRVTALEGAGVLPPAALPFAWAAIRAQLNGRNPEAAQETLARFAPQIRNRDDARSWLMLIGWSGWTPALAETAIDLAERYRSEDAELTGAILGGLLTATGEPSRGDTPQPDTPTSETQSHENARRLVLPEALSARFQTLLTDPPASKALTMMSGGAEDLVRLVEQQLGPQEPLIQAAADAVRIGAVPMGLLAWAAGRPVALAITQRAASLIPASSINGAHVTAEIRAAQNALNRTAVLDVTALAIASLIPDRFDQLRAVFADTPTTTAVYDDIIRTRYALNDMLRSSGQLGVRDGRVTLSEYSGQDKEHLAQQTAAFTRIIANLQPADVPDIAEIHNRLGLPNVPHESDAAWLSAAQHALDTGAALWCDDTAVRDLLIGAGIPTFGTVALLHVLKELSDYPEFTDECHDQDIRRLFEAYVVDLPIAVDDIAEVAEAGGWQPASAAVLFARPQLWTLDVTKALWTTVAEKVWDNAPNQLSGWFEIAAVGASTLATPEEVPQAIVRLVSETLVAIGVGPEAADILRPAAVRSIAACSQMATRRRSLSTPSVLAPQLPTEDDLTMLLRRAVTQELTTNHGFTDAMAASIVDAAF